MEESSKKAMSLNQLHNRFITASKTKSTPYTLLSEMKNNGERLVENDAPSFNLSDFDDSPSPLKIVTGHVNEEKVSAKGGGDDSGFGSSYTDCLETQFQSFYWSSLLSKVYPRKPTIKICKQTRRFSRSTQEGKKHLWLSGLTLLLVAEAGAIRLEKLGCREVKVNPAPEGKGYCCPFHNWS